MHAFLICFVKVDQTGELDHIGLDWMKLDQMKQVLKEVVEDFFEEFIEKYIFKDLTEGFDLKM